MARDVNYNPSRYGDEDYGDDEDKFGDELMDKDLDEVLAMGGALPATDEADLIELSFIRYVHRPYRRPDKTAIATPRRSFDHTAAYRVLTASEENDGSELSDISTPANVGPRGEIELFNLVRAFYVGAEADLDRYLRWLHNVALIDEYGLAKDLVVIEQTTDSLQREWKTLNRSDRLHILFPGELDSWGLLIGGSTKPGRRHRWSMY